MKCNEKSCFTIFIPVLEKQKIISRLSTRGGLFVLNKVNSTNKYIADNIVYLKSGDVFVTEYQTQGKGRRGRIWISPVKQSICLSIYWKLHEEISFNIVEFSLMISVIMANFLKNLGISQIKIKWPNDLYVYGRKLAGILIEIITRNNSVMHLIIGIGINFSLCSHIKSKIEMSKNWISLKDIGINLDRNMLIAMLIDELRLNLKQFEYYGFSLFVPFWKSLDFLYKKSVILCTYRGVKYDGFACGLSETGALLIRNKTGLICSHARDDIISLHFEDD